MSPRLSLKSGYCPCHAATNSRGRPWRLSPPARCNVIESTAKFRAKQHNRLSPLGLQRSCSRVEVASTVHAESTGRSSDRTQRFRRQTGGLKNRCTRALAVGYRRARHPSITGSHRADTHGQCDDRATDALHRCWGAVHHMTPGSGLTAASESNDCLSVCSGSAQSHPRDSRSRSTLQPWTS